MTTTSVFPYWSITPHLPRLRKIVKWDLKVEYLNNKLLSVVYSINVLKSQVTIHVLKVYFANFDLFIIQKMTLRSILRIPWRESCRTTFCHCQVVRIQVIVFYPQTYWSSFTFFEFQRYKKDDTLPPPQVLIYSHAAKLIRTEFDLEPNCLLN